VYARAKYWCGSNLATQFFDYTTGEIVFLMRSECILTKYVIALPALALGPNQKRRARLADRNRRVLN
jgi:hypothetical protein